MNGVCKDRSRAVIAIYPAGRLGFGTVNFRMAL
jgi:hypothetical protein